MSDSIQHVEIYRGVGIHDCQPPARIKAVVKPAIDLVFALTDAGEMFTYAGAPANPPEARLLAAAMAKALHQIAAEDRTERPNINLTLLEAATAGVGSRRWRSPTHFGSLFDCIDDRDRRPPEYQAQVEADILDARAASPAVTLQDAEL